MLINPARRLLALGLFASALAYSQAPAVPQQTQPAQPLTQPAQPAAGSAVVPINLNNVSLLEVINELARELKINYVLDASIKGGSVTVNTFGTIRDVDLRPLLETILRMNNLAMVLAGNIYRIVPIATISHQPITPVTQSDPSKIPDDEREMLNLIFLRYATSSEMVKILLPFMGDGGQIQSYDPANLLIILDNSRNMRRMLDLIAMFDSDTFAGQRVRAFEVKNGRPGDIAKELDEVFKAYSLSNGKDHGSVQFVPIERVNTILAVAPNPSVFEDVEKWLAKLDIPAKVTAGSIDNYVYKLKYGRAEILGGVISQLYGGCAPSIGAGGYGGGYGVSGNSSYPSTGYAGAGGGSFGGGSAYGNGGGYGGGGGGYGGQQGGQGYGGGGYGGGYGGGGYGGGYGGGGYGGGGYGGGNCGGYGGGGGYGTAAANPMTTAFGPQSASGRTASGTPAAAGSAPVAGASTDQTGSYLDSSAGGGMGGSQLRIIPNPFDNTLLIQSTPQQWEQVKKLLDQLDISPRQVLIEAKIYEVDLSGSFSAGVQAFLQQKGASNSAGITSQQLQGSNNAGGSVQTLLSAGTLVGQSRQLLALLTLEETKTKAKVLSAPSIIATDSIPASITIGDSVPTLSSQAVNPGVTSGGNSLFTQTISNTSTGIGLNILARVNSSGIVTMVINQSVTAPEPNPSGTSIDSPSFSQRNVSTQVTVQDGDTIAIGGIINESTTDTSAGIPILDRIPYLGAAFGQKSTTKKRTELIIFLTPRVIYDTNQIADATQELKDKVKGLRKLIQNDIR